MDLLGLMVVLFFIFLRKLCAVFHQFTFPPTVHRDSLFSTFLPKLILVFLISAACEVLSCGVDLHFLYDE